ncbi:MAG: aminoglycoside phosphotransferase family protein [Clostridia bacterium]
MKLSISDVQKLAGQFTTDGQSGTPVPYGAGHINDTYLFDCRINGKKTQYVLQRINKAAFPKPNEVMENMLRITEYLRGEIERRGGDPERETLRLGTTQSGAFFAIDENDDYWRAYSFVADTVSYDRSGDERIFRESGRAFGRFQDMLAGFDAASLYETIVNFHHTPNRFRAFREAVKNDAAGRVGEVREMVAEALRYEGFAGTLVDALNANELPLRVTHNDTKLNNVLIDEKTGLGLCVIDLDTVMPGLSAYDFGDAIRYGASTADEDERDLQKVHLSLPLYRAYAEGYLSEVGRSLTEKELASLPVGAKMMTLENMIRFLGDYLNGDRYFKIDYPEHNLVRARTQLALLREMDAHWAEMTGIIAQLGKGANA